MRKKDDEKERSIKEAVIKLILQEGFHGASVSKIAKMAGVSPATVYVYYENKENMLQDIYLEYSEEVYDYLIDRVNKGVGGPQRTEQLIRGYYDFILVRKEIFSFVEQFANCPSLISGCSREKGICNLRKLIAEMKQNKILKPYSEDNLLAVILYPVKAIALDIHKSSAEKEVLLQELIKIILDAILV